MDDFGSGAGILKEGEEFTFLIGVFSISECFEGVCANGSDCG